MKSEDQFVRAATTAMRTVASASLLTLAACGGGDANLAAPDNALVQSIAAAMSEDDGDLLLGDRAAAECFARRVVGELGEGRLSDLGVTVDAPFSEGTISDVAFDDAEIDVIVDALGACIDLEENVAMAFANNGSMSRAVADCVAAEIGEGAIRDGFRADFAGAADSPVYSAVDDALARCSSTDSPPPLEGASVRQYLGEWGRYIMARHGFAVTCAGQITIFDQGARSADVVLNEPVQEGCPALNDLGFWIEAVAEADLTDPASGGVYVVRFNSDSNSSEIGAELVLELDTAHGCGLDRAAPPDTWATNLRCGVGNDHDSTSGATSDGDSGVVELRPVLQCGADLTASEDGEAVLPQLGSDIECLVGSPSASDEVFEIGGASAATDEATGSWIVTVELRRDRQEIWGALAAECFNATATCPSRQLAIVLDGVIQSAPAVTTLDFSDTVQISGAFSEVEAQALARSINSGG